ncbi:bis(5'nucleosyl)-tetraphosphatase ApaH [Bisgaardia hudsonensis]|uniref:Bis(5'-nucleosyl)-tetraphosphatase, symmetrical n=1 Tax=Bisgaardia hudsonensis TaxID=109472 RepID=A0A4R2MZY0_9PAST|nr:bis(5'-nucleosyl)-tetraphosphatase (symmetrical) ApaH [Bisgaardia hudsonensis]QLB13691.1 bis(5'-nucleosyl)-tetraphosphatase (symmetrical) [Bisgaardia hudsonensis]TCP12025.1 bis(5'nucleosyl)-tetraphosphatase ApaH [Bisgaardia hudsonensis]
MATYLVGDLQGCYDELRLLLDKVNFEPSEDELYLVGDLVARGDKSLECLRFVKSLGGAGHTVLGNHDLHLISTALGIKKVKPKDHVDAIFTAPDFQELMDWLRKQPLLIHHQIHNFLVVHAGISPDWDLDTAKACAKEVECILRSDDYADLLKNMYENKPDRWSEDLQGLERLRYIINVFTRMRFCYVDNRLDFDCKVPPEQAPKELTTWFSLANPLFKQQNIIFGHWASLVDSKTPSNIYALDTGCVWGNRMTMLRWEDKQYFEQPAVKDYR